MSRSSHLMRQIQLQQQQQQMAENDAAALAAEMFDHFCIATTMRQVLGLYRNMCDAVGLRPSPLNEFYPKLKAKIKNWKAAALWKKFDARASHRVYNKGNSCTGTRVLVIGAGPCGLRTAIEAQLLGAKVVVIEKRDRISRNNVLHLWPFVITDLRNLGAKKFYGKFCAGSIDHISIRQLQCILLKVALLLGVEIHEGVSFENVIEPTDGSGWRAQVSPEDHAVSHYEFDVLIGADGKRNTLEGFKRKEFRGKLAIAITANFINKKTEAEAKVEEISGVAFIFNQSFFKELYQTTGIDLENIVYYKDETHYFVMTAKKHSLIDKGVIIQDFADPAELLSPANVNTEKLLDYAREAAEFSTKYQMPNLEFAVNHYGKPDVAMFDFTSMFAAESSCRVTVRRNYRLLQCLVGDSLLEPFWPTGSGCARGFLSSMDAAYAIKLWSNTKNSILGVLAQRESIYRLLAQTTPENLQRDIGAYTLDPVTRYPNLNKSTVNVWQVKNLLDSDDQVLFEQTHMDTSVTQNVICETPVRRKRRSGDTLPLSAILLRWIKAQLHAYEFTQHLNEVSDVFTNGKVLVALINRYRPDLVDLNVVKDWSPKDCNELAFKILENEMGIHRIMSSKESITLEGIDSKIWLNYLEQICEVFRGEIPHVKHPKLDLSEFQTKSTTNRTPDFSNLLQISSNRKGKSPLQDIDMTTNVTHRRSVLDEDRLRKQRKFAAEYNPPAVDTSRRAKKRRSHEKSGNIDRERGIPSALPRGTDEQFTDRIKSMEQRITSRNNYGAEKKPKDLLRAIGKLESNDWNVREIEKKIEQSKKTEAIGKNREKVPKWSKEQFLARQHKMSKPIDRQQSVDEKYKEIDQTIKNLDKQLRGGLEVGERGKNKVASIAGQFIKKDDTSEEKSVPIPKSTSKVGLVFNKQSKTEKCNFCKQTVYLMERISAENLILHRSCLKCHHCHTNLRLGGYAFDRDDPIGKFYCTQHYRLPAKEIRPVVRRSRNQRKNDSEQNQNPSDKNLQTPVRGRPGDVAQLDLLDRGQTPERIEFENIDAMSDGEPSLENVIDENEWTDRNFITGDEDTESDLSNSDSSDDDTESDMFEEANGSPIGAQTLQLANDWIGKQKYSNVIDSDEEDDFYDSSEGLLEDDADSQTEGEEFKKAREMRRQEVKLQPPPENLPTDTETEVQTDTESSSPSNVELNSATEISTDSEFDHDPIVREAPRIFIDDTHIKKPTKVQVKQGIVTSSPTHKLTHNNNNMNNGKNQPAPIIIKELPQLEFKPLVQVDPSLLNSNRLPLKNPRAGDYLLNKTPSTEGIASKKSLELKKRYLLGEQGIGNGIMKSGSTSILDSKLKNFNSYISECQKLLNPGADISPSMKSFLDKTKIGDNNSSKICSSNSNNSASNLTVMKNSVNESDKKDSEKENMFVNSRNELNKSATSASILTTINNSTNVGSNGGSGGGSGNGVGGNSGEYSETVNTALVENISKSVTTQKVKSPILETIDLISPEKSSVPLIDLTKIDIPSEMIKSNQNFIKNIEMEMENDKIIDLTADTPPIKDKLSEKNEKKIIDEKPDVSKDVKEVIPDIITHIENVKNEKHLQHKLSEKNLYSHNEEKDQNHKQQKDNDIQETCIEVPNIPWNNKTKNESDMESDSLSSSSTTSSLEDIPHYILDSTTSPDTQNLIGIEQIVPRLEVHDSSGALMQIDSLMIIDGKYVGDPEDIKLLDIPEGTKIDFPISHSEIQKKGEQKEIKEKKQKEEEGKENEKEEIDVNETDEKLSSSDKESTPTNKPKLIPKFDSATVTQIHQMEEIVDDDKLMIVSTRPNLKFDSKNENKIDTLKNIPLIMEKDDKMKVIKPTTLDLGKSKVINTSTIYSSDKDKTPIAERTVSDSETEVTGQVLTETELSDWTADDAVSENFVDIEFALNSNKGTIKRNKRAKKKSPSPSSKGKIPSSFISIQQQQQKNQQNQQQQQQRKQRENAQTSQTPQTPTKDCGIFRNLDIDEIEFMDTGSEGSYAETYSATNRAMLMNRGYIKFIENNTNDMSDNYRGDKNSHIRSDLNDTMSASGKEVCGVDYIEQGACILSNDYDLKTPVNEIFPTFSSKQQSQVISSSGQQQQSQQSSIDVANDIDEDSLQYLTSQGTTDLYTTTTEESEALTVVTSPLESAPKMSLPDNTVTTTSPTSSSDKNDKTTSSTTASSKIPIKKSSSSEREQRRSEERSKQSSKEDLLGMNNNKNKEMDEMSYEEYVRKLQLKITQISNARDSIDVRKQKRKSSKSEVGTVGSIGVSEGTQNNNSVIENKNLSIFEPNRSLTTMTVMPSITASSSSISVQQNQKVPEIPTLSRKLEEITKERTKQKDLIHDLVMDKLQSKKQLNAEKRLNRSRNRSIFCPGSMSPSPSKVAISSSGCSNSPHYHIPSSSERRNSKEMLDIQQQEQQLQQQKENVYSKTKFSPKDNKQIIQMFSNSPRLKQRPLSDNFETATNLIFDQTPKITKTQSFCIYTPRNSPFTQGDKMKIEQFAIDNTSFATPLPPPRANRKYDETLSASREKLRAEARARARLKSNEELGLSPEEKLQMLRRRYHLDMHEITSSSVATTPIASVSPSNLLSIIESSNKSDDNKLRERKMVTSKSVNDITAVQVNLNSDENLNDGESSRELIDFTSDPNLSSQQEKPIKCHRRKDPERRKSLIQTVSSFFNKKKDKDSSPQSPAKEKSSDSVFSRFKISPKSKEKSKSCFDVRTFGFGDKDLIASGDIQGIISNNNTYSPSLTTKDATYSSSPQLFKRQEDVVSPPPIPPLPTNYQRSDDESYTTESRDQKKQRAISKASRQAELKRLRIAQEIQREQEEIEVKLKELEAKGVLIEKTLRGEDENIENLDSSTIGASDEKLFKELLGIWRNITQLKKRDEELAIQQQELQLEHRHAQLREELDMRLSCSKLDKSSADVAAEGAILNEMLEIVAKRAALRPTETVGTASNTASVSQQQQQQLQSNENDDSDI